MSRVLIRCLNNPTWHSTILYIIFTNPIKESNNNVSKRVYFFGDGQAEGTVDMRMLLGGKGANLAEMNLIGIPVPAGFTITTEVCHRLTINSGGRN